MTGIPRSGPSPEPAAKQRSRDDVSSAADAIRLPAARSPCHNIRAALDAGSSAPLPPGSGTGSEPQRRLLTARVVANMVGVCTETVLRWIRNGELPAIRLPGGAIRIAEAEFDQWLAERATPRRGSVSHPDGRRPSGTLSLVSHP
jgi:excisionase family DNA binding protein